ncbi:MAG: class I SAM-dependent methyltransferase [Betaproteobacteria bacterium]|nr:class I SAM-dependent methyltransferase [Betaproteobacteria bacterium]
MTIAAIDFCRLYSDHMTAAGRAKPSSAWDKRVPDIKRKEKKGRYAGEFISRMDLTDARTLLDVGCGTGAISLPLAARLERVIGLDYSQGMLDEFKASIAEQGITNADALHLAWEDDWSEVPECDIVVASRSTMVQDIGAALAKLDAKAKKRVYLTHLVDGRFIDPRIFDAIGRKPLPMPDYIYVLNILHSRNIHPRLDYIDGEGPLTGITEFDELLQRTTWAIGELDTNERARLQAWFEEVMENGGLNTIIRWAFISWDVNLRQCYDSAASMA